MDVLVIGLTEELHAQLEESAVAVPRSELTAVLERLERSHRLDPYSQLVADLIGIMKQWLNVY